MSQKRLRTALVGGAGVGMLAGASVPGTFITGRLLGAVPAGFLLPTLSVIRRHAR